MKIAQKDITVTKQFSFCYGHYLPNYEGPCKNQHGHNSILEVEINSNHLLHTYPGMVLDFGELKRIVKESVIDKLDHRNINDVPGFEELNPTAENMVRWVMGRLLTTPLKMAIVRIRIYETPTSYAEWKA